jgi:hypothetical protein
VWKSDLKEEDVLIFEFMTEQVLRKHGYNIERDKKINKTIVIYYVQSQLLRIMDWRNLLKRPKKVRKIINIKIMRWRDKMLYYHKT